MSSLLPLGTIVYIWGVLFIIYLTFYKTVFQSARDLETDFTKIIIPSFKEQQKNKFLDFFSEEAGNHSTKLKKLTEGQIDDAQFQSYLMALKEKIRVILYSFINIFKNCLIAELILEKIDKLESKGKNYCVAGIILIIPSIGCYIIRNESLMIYIFIFMLLLLIIPIIICSILAFKILHFTAIFKQKKKEIEAIWEI